MRNILKNLFWWIISVVIYAIPIIPSLIVKHNLGIKDTGNFWIDLPIILGYSCWFFIVYFGIVKSIRKYIENESL